MDQLLGHRILVFLPPAAARVIASKLNDEGYQASVVSTLPDLERILPASDCSLVITTRPDIDVVRNLKPLPVVNLEIFFYFNLQQTTTDVGRKTFDTDAFLTRVKALVEPRHHTATTAFAPAKPSGKDARGGRSALTFIRQICAVAGGRFKVLDRPAPL